MVLPSRTVKVKPSRSWSFKLADGGTFCSFFEVSQYLERNFGRLSCAEKAVKFLGRRVEKASMKSV